MVGYMVGKDPHLDHVIGHIRELADIAVMASRNPTLDDQKAEWHAIHTSYVRDGVHSKCIESREAAVYLVWLLAREVYESPRDFEQDYVRLVAALALSEPLWPQARE